MATSGLANADSWRLVNADGSELGELCIAAVSSPDVLATTAKALGVSMLELDTVRCNGYTLSVFAAKYRTTDSRPAAGYKLTKSDTSPVTELCMASARSPQEFAKVKELYFSNEANVEAEVLCNGMPLKTFARKYRAPSLTISQR
jgi:hypothetical protein